MSQTVSVTENIMKAIYWLPKGTLVKRSNETWEEMESFRTTLDAYYTHEDFHNVVHDTRVVALIIPDEKYPRLLVGYEDLIPKEYYPVCGMCGRTFKHYHDNMITCLECCKDRKTK